MRRIIGSVVAVLAVLGALLVSPATAAPDVDTTALQDAVTVDGIREHQQELQDIADANGGTRASGTPGTTPRSTTLWARSRPPGTSPSFRSSSGTSRRRRRLSSISWRRRHRLRRSTSSPPTGSRATSTMASASGEVTEPIVPTNDIVIPPGNQASTSDSGCEEEDFADADFTGAIAPIQRGTCDFIVKAMNAEAAGAVGVIIFNEGQPGRDGPLLGTLGAGGHHPRDRDELRGRRGAGELAQAGETIVHIFTETFTEPRTTFNVLADLGGRSKRVVVVGAHLDGGRRPGDQ